LITDVMQNDTVRLVYSHYDRFIAGGAVPYSKQLTLSSIDPIKAEYFLQRRELGIINVGNEGIVKVDGNSYKLAYKDALYIGQGNKEILFDSVNYNNPAKFYFTSAPAHRSYPNKTVTFSGAVKADLGSAEQSNARTINKLIIHGLVDTCQLQMGLTELKPGSVWNTMPAHTHSRRMEVYFYFEVPDGQSICHFMGQPEETRHIWMQNMEAVISPDWSIHSAAGTSNYSFIWSMAGENLDYSDMDFCKITDMK
ncbi:MAG: 5-dehydro-4-deoxy-D-glucuronate isomerase, partial [Bacteroidales bacterium]|nr:5-dehydro-4-deoxy-D-glucuronate isomerase [Bacteroidales bacterium]